MKAVWIECYRTIPGILGSYGRAVNGRLDRLVGGADKWNMSQFHGSASVPGTGIKIERHEDGPEFLSFVLTQLPNYVSAIAAVASAWLAHKALKGSKELRTIKVRIGKHSYEGPVKD